MRVTMIGAGYVGLVSGACFADFGHQVVCVDKDAAKIEQLCAGKSPIFEPFLDPLIAGNVEAGRLSFSTQAGPAIRSADAGPSVWRARTAPSTNSTKEWMTDWGWMMTSI